MTPYYPARDGHLSIFALEDNAETDKKLQVIGKGAMSAPFLTLEPGGRWGQTETIDRAANT
jgi:hypothetical protein